MPLAQSERPKLLNHLWFPFRAGLNFSPIRRKSGPDLVLRGIEREMVWLSASANLTCDLKVDELETTQYFPVEIACWNQRQQH